MDFISPWIHTTERCNLNCHYCYVTGNNDMERDVYIALEKMLVESPAKYKHLRFAGGEPTLVFHKWESFAKRMLEWKGVTIEVLTNLITIPNGFWEFANLKYVNLSVSIDNGKSVKVLDKSIADKLKRINNPWILTTITSENIDNLDLLATFIGKNKYGWCLTTDYFEATLPELNELAARLDMIVDILKTFKYDFRRISFNNCSLGTNFSGCRAGNEMFTVAPDGKIYACQTLIGKTPIGDVWSGYTPKEIKERDTCTSCNLSPVCTGWCPLHFKTPNSLCKVLKYFGYRIMKEVHHA